MSSGGGGGGGSANVPTPNPGATNIFPDQGQAQTSALAGTQGIANNTFYPMPQVTSFLFPGGIPGSIAPEGGTPARAPQTVTSPPPPSGMGFDQGAGFSTMNPQDTYYYGAPDTTAQLAQDMFGSVQAGGQYSSNPMAIGPTNPGITATDTSQLQSLASGAATDPWVSQSMAQQYLQGNYTVADQLASTAQGGSGWIDAVEQQAAQGSLQHPSTGQGPQPWTPPPSAAWGSGGGGGGGTTTTIPGQPAQPPPAQIGSQLNPALAGFLGGASGAAADLMGDSNPMDWMNANQSIGGIFGGSGTGGQMGPSQLGGMGGTDWIQPGQPGYVAGGGGGQGGMGMQGGMGPGGAAPGLASGQPGTTLGLPLPASNTAGFGSGSPGFGPTQPGQTGSPIGLNQNSQGTQTSPGAADFQNPITGSEAGSSQIGGTGFGGQNNFQPTAANFVSPGTQGTGQGQGGSGLNFSYPGAAAYLGLGPQIAASAMDVPPILQGAGGALLNTGFDPQNALYARTQNQNAQQAAANEGNAGLGNTPYGTSVENLNNENFNIDWQNAQEARQATALQGAGQAFGTAQTLQNQGLTGLQAGAMGATAQDQQSIQDYLQYASAATAQNQLPIELYQAEAQAANAAQANSQQASQAGKGQATGLASAALGAI